MAKVKQIEINEKYLWIGGGILTLVIIIFVAGRTSANKSNQDPSDANPNIQPITVSTQNGSIDWNPSALVKKIHTAYEINWTSGRCEVLEELAELQDTQLLAVTEGYHRVYGKTLRKLLNDAWTHCFSLSENAAPSDIIRRMDILQIP